MSGFRFQLGSVHKPSARIKLTSEKTRFKMSSILFTLPHTTSWCILQRQLRSVVPTFLFIFPTRLSLMTVVARSHLFTMHTSWISVLQKICSPVTVLCIIIIFRNHLFSAKFELTTAKNAVSWAQHACFHQCYRIRLKIIYCSIFTGPSSKVLCCLYVQPVLRLMVLGTFAQFRKATNSCVMFFCPSSRMEQLGFNWTDIHEIWCLRIFRKSVEKLQVSLKWDKNNGHFTCTPIYIFYHISLISSYNEICFRQWCRENKHTHLMFNDSFSFLKYFRFGNNVEKYCIAGQATDDNMAHAYCMLNA